MWRQDGCTAPDCGTEETVLVDGEHGRRCATHAVLPTTYWSRELADDLTDAAGPDRAFDYLAGYLTAEIDHRFQAVTI